MFLGPWRTVPGRVPFTSIAVISSPCVCLSRRTLKHRSLASDDPFGERSALDDPSDGIYAAWSGVDQDAFVNAAASPDVRAAHFGPEWSKFSTIGRLSAQKAPRRAAPPLTAEALHARELRSKRRALERNFATYEAYAAAELGVGSLKETTDFPRSALNPISTADRPADEVDGEEALEEEGVEEAALEEEEDAFGPLPLPSFLRAESTPPTPRRADGPSVPAALMELVLHTLGDPHGDPRLPRTDPLQWTTEDVVLWITRIETTMGGTDGEDAGVGPRAMDDPALAEAFRMAKVNGAFLLHHTVPSSMFQVMRRWYTRRQEIAHAAMTRKAKGTDEATAVKEAVAAGRCRLDEVAAKVTPELIQETICQCYPYCR